MLHKKRTELRFRHIQRASFWKYSTRTFVDLCADWIKIWGLATELDLQINHTFSLKLCKDSLWTIEMYTFKCFVRTLTQSKHYCVSSQGLSLLSLVWMFSNWKWLYEIVKYRRYFIHNIELTQQSWLWPAWSVMSVTFHFHLNKYWCSFWMQWCQWWSRCSIAEQVDQDLWSRLPTQLFSVVSHLVYTYALSIKPSKQNYITD